MLPKTVVLNVGPNNLVGDAAARENTPAETAAGIEEAFLPIPSSRGMHLCPRASALVF